MGLQSSRTVLRMKRKAGDVQPGRRARARAITLRFLAASESAGQRGAPTEGSYGTGFIAEHVAGKCRGMALSDWVSTDIYVQRSLKRKPYSVHLTA